MADKYNGMAKAPDPTFYIYIYSNDGGELLKRIALLGAYRSLYLLDDEHTGDSSVTYEGYGVYSYGGYLTTIEFSMDGYLGLSETINATTPTVLPSNSPFTNTGDWDSYNKTYYVVPNRGGDKNTLDVTYNSQKIIDSLEVTPPVAVTYNGSAIATLNAGDTKTLSCNEKVMSSNVGIGGKTLQCSGKVMASNLLVSISGGTQIDPITFIEGEFSSYENELVTSIGTYAFQGCTALTDISFPNATSIGDYAFYNCTALRVLRVGLQSDTVCRLTSTNAIPSNIQTIYVPASLADAYKADENWSSFADKIVGV